MSSNHSGQNGNVCSSYNQHESLYERVNVCKWRRGLLLMWLMLFPVCVWILISLALGKLGSEVETLLMTGDDSQYSSICNASMEKVASLTCCSEAEIVMPPWHAVTCALKILGSKNCIFNRQSKLATENVEFGS